MSERCDACGGCGVHFNVTPYERCDLCAKFESDQAARHEVKRIVRSHPALVAERDALREALKALLQVACLDHDDEDDDEAKAEFVAIVERCNALTKGGA